MKKVLKSLSVLVFLSVLTEVKGVDYPEFKSGVKSETLLQYLAKTVQISENLKNGSGDSDDVLELRNRIDSIYSIYLLRFSPEIEKTLLSNLVHVSKKNPEGYIRDEAKMAIEIIRKRHGSNSYATALKEEKTYNNKAARELIKDTCKKISEPSRGAKTP